MHSVISAAESSIGKEIETIKQLSEIASKHSYYKFNYAWTRQVQDAVSRPVVPGTTLRRGLTVFW